jgi:peptidoglycan/LPS O-acetylase OafA/YrhL
VSERESVSARAGWTLGRIVVTAAAIVGAVAALIAGTGYGFWVVASLVGLLLVATGALVNRRWIVAVPLGAAAVWGIFLAAGSGQGYSDPPWEFWLILGFVAAAVFAACLLAGVGFRRAARAAKTGERRGDVSAPGRS